MCRKPLGASLCGPRTARGLWPGLDVAVNGSGGGGGGLPSTLAAGRISHHLIRIVLLQASSC